MSETKLRVILLTHGGVEVALQRLAALDCVTIAGIFIETDITRRVGFREKLKRSIRYDGYAATAAKFVGKLAGRRTADDGRATRGGHDLIGKIAQAHNIPVHFVANYHSPDSIALMKSAQSDLGVVLGTNILKESVFKIPRLGSINLHQGLAPLYRGGPAVFWELFNGESEIGLTVHFVESKVDTGEIILQQTVPLEYDYSFGTDFDSFIAHFREGLVGRCAQLIADAVQALALGAASPRPQDTSCGKRYRLPVKNEKDELKRRLRQRQRTAPGRLQADQVGGR